MTGSIQEVDVDREDELREFSAWERASWERRAQAYTASLGALTSGSVEPLLHAARVRRGTRVLDVGTGPGFIAVAAAKRRAVVTALDQSAAMVRSVRVTGVTAVQAGVDALPFRNGQFAAVVAGYLINHLAWPEASIDELERVLAPAGRLAFTVWDRAEINPAVGLFNVTALELGLTASLPSGPDPQRFADEGEVRALLIKWRDVSIERLRWSVRVEPGAWFDAIAEATPRTGAVLAQASPKRRAEARNHYVQLATARYGDTEGCVLLPAAAVLVGATKASSIPK